MYSDYALIKKSTLTEIGDAIRTQKGTTEPIDPVNFGSEISAIEGGTSVEGGFTVNFHDEDGTLIETHSAELGRDIYAPASFNEVNYWSDENGVPYTMPLTINTADTVLDLYATEAKTCMQVLYDAFGISPEDCPQVAVDGFSDGSSSIMVHFGTDVISRDIWQMNYGNHGLDKFDMLTVVQYIVENKDSCSRNQGGYMAEWEEKYYYTNFDLSWGEDGRLEEVMYIHDGDKLHPYALQEKTVTESGDVVPDEGYYGLSKVSVNVESGGGTSIDGGYTVNFYDENNELLQITAVKSGMQIEAPVYYVSGWCDSNGLIYTFPVTINTDIELSPLTGTLSDSLYSFYNVDRQTYPYVFVRIDGYNFTENKIAIAFCENLSISGDVLYFSDGAYVGYYNFYGWYSNAIKTSIDENPTALEAIQYCMANIPTLGTGGDFESYKTYQMVNHATYAVYTNKKDLINESATEIIYFD